ncbi:MULTISPECIES: shikimate kinase AroK [unclassified Oleiphilus]|nr:MULTISPECIES: shikimate kinase AroK [unclassified Oleiphilus]
MSIAKPLIVFVGPMGAGKTTIGKILAKELNFDFYDSDKEIERRTGANIPWIFDVEGEAGFRDRESQAIKDLSALKNVVLATGGGAMMRPENRECVNNTAFVVYLNTSVEQQYKRTHKDKNRPLLQGDKDARQVLSDLYATRDPIYREVADYVIDTDKKSMKGIVKDIISAIEKE